MSFFGISEMELAVILLVALLVFGPERMIDMARRAGRFWREAQRTVRYAIDTAMTDEEKKAAASKAQEPVDTPEDAVERPSARPAQGPGDVAPGPTPTNGHQPANGHHPAAEDVVSGEDGMRRG